MPSDATLMQEHRAGADYRAIAVKYHLNPDSVRARVSRANRRQRAVNLDAPAPEVRAEPKPDMAPYLQYLLIRRAIDDLPPPAPVVAPGPVDDTAAWDELIARLSNLTRAARILYTSDQHFPDHDPLAIRMVEDIALWYGPDLIVHGGDVFDMDAISRFQHDYRKGKQDALRHARLPYQSHIQRLRSDNPNAAQVYIDGNHTAPRIQAYLNDHWEFADTVLDTYQALVRANGAVMYMGAVEEVEIGGLFLQHGRRVGKNAARLAQDDLGGSTPMVQGHAHTPQVDVRRVRRSGGRGYRVVQSIVNGCLCRMPAAYDKRTQQSKWLQSVTLAHVEMDGDLVNQQLVLFHERANGNLCAFIGKRLFEVSANAEARPTLKMEKKVA